MLDKVVPSLFNFFLIVSEALMCLITKVVSNGRLRGTSLLGKTNQQSISQYVFDSSFIIREEKIYVDELVRLLKVFSEASEMKIK